MTLPTISPTGSMASGDYISYMISYLDGAMDSLEDDIDGVYITDRTVTDWNNKWGEVLSDLTTRVTELNSDISEIQSQIIMAKNIIISKQ